MGIRSSVAIRYRVDVFQPIVHVEYDIDRQEEHSLLKVPLPTAYAGHLARFGSPFGSILRGQQAGQSREEAMFESVGSRWDSVSDDGETEGLGIFTEAKYSFPDAKAKLAFLFFARRRPRGDLLGTAVFRLQWAEKTC